MALQPGTRLGAYEILGLIGAGGMGEVYKARDTRLDRNVALKILPDRVSRDPERRARFDREARVIASLTHPNICTLHDVGVDGDSAYFVMELLAGDTLAERLSKGRMPLETALSVAIEIGEALTVAHRAGIVHRDLKPGNVTLTKTSVKLLDFGLARLVGHGALPAVVTRTVTSPVAAPLTDRGTLLGTLPYMAPEQLQGQEADARTDLWALGAILYEMLTGTRAFDAPSAVSLVGAILEREPVSLATRLPLTPPPLDRLVRQCLAKSPDDRWDTAHDVVAELKWIRGSEATSPAPKRTPVWQRALWLGTGVVVGVAAALLVSALAFRRAPLPVPAIIRTSLDVQSPNGTPIGPGGWTVGGSRTALAWTPDGHSLVFVGRKGDSLQLYVRSLDRDQARPLAGTDGAIAPAVSADGQWVAFWADGAIRKVPLAGGPGQLLESDPDQVPTRLTWSNSNDLFYDSPTGIRQLGPAGGKNLTRHEENGPTTHTLASLLPGDRVVLYTVRKRLWTWGDEQIVAYEIATGQTKVLVHDAADARYVRSGHLLFLRRGTLFAVPFDPVRVEVRGTPVALLDGVAQALSAGNSDDVTGAGQFAVGPTGALAWLPSVAVPYPDASLVAISRTGQVTTLPAPARAYSPGLRVAPDGRRLVVIVQSLTGFSLCVYDVARGTLTTLTNDGEVSQPTWTPDGKRLAFQTLRAGRTSLNWFTPDGSGGPEELANTASIPSSWLPTGRGLAMWDSGHIQLAIVGEDRKATLQPPIAAAPRAGVAEFAPNGRWIAYQAVDSGQSEVYVQPFPGPGPRQQVSTQEGWNPAWNPNGSELFFLAPASGDPTRDRMMVVAVHEGPALTLGAPRQLFEFTNWKGVPECVPTRCYDVAPDGQRFFAVRHTQLPDPPAATHINLIVNWLEELKQKVPTGLP